MAELPSAGSPAAILHGFPPVLDGDARRLILGSFPSAASLAAGHYYAHPRNQFWLILGEALGEPLAELPFEVRYARVRAHQVGIWDVLSACARRGSLDSAIRQAQPNDFDGLRALAPDIEQVFFNGKLAGRFARSFAAAGFRVKVLPSTSPAYAAMSLQAKQAVWLAALNAPIGPCCPGGG